MKLCDILKNVEYKIVKGPSDIDISCLVYDSRKVQDGDVFVCIKGAKWDAHDMVLEVIKSGAVAVVVEKDLSDEVLEQIAESVAVAKVESSRYALACMSAAYFDYPSEKLTTIGVTGTKGKTTTAYMIRAV
ncbi:MAG: Mur ligase domain-containing protein, partial [Lachnospiraceae bacterium]|nr:Mur ligase domain-containing protein [Lachnospiraceae bacterium]